MSCADNCPTGALKSTESLRRHALIHDPQCTGCGKCKEACPFNAIAGEKDHHHSVIEWNCTGCGSCEKACPDGCIEMVKGGKYRV